MIKCILTTLIRMSCVKPKISLKKLNSRLKDLEKKVNELSELVQTQTKGKKRGPKKSETETITNIDCFGNINGSIDIAYTNTVNGMATSFSWQGPNGFSSSQKDISNLGTGSYVLSITEDNHCITTRSYTINEPDFIEVIEQTQGTSCFNDNDGELTNRLSIFNASLFDLPPKRYSPPIR